MTERPETERPETADLVVFGEDWGGHPSSTQHLIHRLGGDRKVVWVNSIGLRRPRLTAGDLGRAVRKLTAFGSRGPRPDATAAAGYQPDRIVSPLAVPLPGNPLARFVNRRLLSAQIRGALDAAGVRRPILWTSLPTAVDVVGRLGERALVYYCGDDFRALAGVDHRPVAALEEELVDKADLILAASPALAARFPAARTLLVPHGADVALFATPAAAPADLGPVTLDCPVAGFYGSLSDWINVELLAHAARTLPYWRFVLIGPVRCDVSALSVLPNVALPGERPHADLPGYAQNWTVSMLPFRDNPQIRACNPLKLREYLAAGSPVVTTEFPALKGYRDLLLVADGPDAFVRALLTARAHKSLTYDVEVKRARVASQTWERRAAEIARRLEDLS